MIKEIQWGLKPFLNNQDDIENQILKIYTERDVLMTEFFLVL